MIGYSTTAVLPHHLQLQIVLYGHINHLDVAAKALFPHLAVFQPVIYTNTQEDELRIFFHREDAQEDFDLKIEKLIPKEVTFTGIVEREGEHWQH
jgi:hypothetical protein